MQKIKKGQQYALINNLKAFNANVYPSYKEAENIAVSLLKSGLITGSIQIVKLEATVNKFGSYHRGDGTILEEKIGIIKE